uniref:Zinc finger and BTB domain containing 48 n=1 Tax=Electrophorus electricus TaxID=8005 RepID=A0A4W4GUC5_ELEEL
MELSAHAQRVLTELNRQRGRGTFCDVTLSTPRGQVFVAHRNVLACFSRLFHEPASATPCLEISLPQDCPEDGLELLLHFFYTGELQLSGDSELKVRHAARGLSVPQSLILGQGSRGIQPPSEPGCGEVVEGKLPFLSSPVDDKPSLTAKGPCLPRQRAKNKVEPRVKAVPPAAELGDSPSTSATTTTRYGRRVKGPSRLLGENPVAGASKPAAPRRRAAALEVKDDVSGTAEGEQRNACVSSGTEVLNASVTFGRQDASGDNRVDSTDEDRDDARVFPEDTDEDYVPHGSPAAPSKGQRGKRRRKGRAGNKENGNDSARCAKKGSVQCPTCHKTFLSKYYLKVHNRRHTGEKPFACAKCGKCYYRKENLQEHEARNCLSRVEAVFSCSRCPKTFKRRQELRLHTVTHTGEMPNKCTSCSDQFMQKKDLKSHMIKVHGAPKPHACSLCTKCFLSRTELRLHEAAKHRGEKLFVCEECGHRASSRNGLQMHIKAIHRNERPFVCEFCSHAFTQKANLNMHLRTHTGEKPFQCHLCGKTFRTQASLDKHHRTHTGERPYCCEFCEQRFTEKGPLVRHIASKHQEGRSHLCHICSKSFKAIEQLRVHVRRHKGMRKFECTECGYKFTRQAHLRRHSQIHSRVENYNPRQRKLRNLVVEDENAPTASTPPDEQRDAAAVETPRDEEAGSAQAVAPGGDPAGVQEAFAVEDVMEHTVLVTDPFPIRSDLVVELQGVRPDGKA